MTIRTAAALIIAPVDPLSSRVGGIQTFVTGFVKFAPPDLRVEIVGVSSGDGSGLDPGTWQTIPVGDSTVPFLPLLRIHDSQARHRLPLSLRFVGAALRRRPMIDTRHRVLQFHRPATLLPFLLSPAPKVQFIHHELAQVETGPGDNRWAAFPRAFNWVEGLTARHVDAVIAVNEETADAFRHRHPGSASIVRFSPNWFDDTVFFPGTDEQRRDARAALRRETRASPDAPVILVAGRLEASKDPLLAVKTFQLLAVRAPAAVMAVAGGGSLEAQVRAHAAPLGERVRLLGTRSPGQLAEIMRGADALLVSSSTETGPTVALEALATGLPVVGPEVGRLPRLVLQRRTGWIAPNRSPEALAEGLLWAIGPAAPGRTDACVAAARPYRARTVLEPLYALHFQLARRGTGHQ